MIRPNASEKDGERRKWEQKTEPNYIKNEQEKSVPVCMNSATIHFFNTHTQNTLIHVMMVSENADWLTDWCDKAIILYADVYDAETKRYM